MSYLEKVDKFINVIKSSNNLTVDQKENLVSFGEKSRLDILIHVDKGGEMTDKKSENHFDVFMVITNHYLSQEKLEKHLMLIRESPEGIKSYANDLYKRLVKKEV